jgi:formylglycine-generating enzyme required for sulfatase activity
MRAGTVVLLTLTGCGWFTTPAAPAGPPDELRCAVRPNYGCFVEVPGGTFQMGAQAASPDAPGYDADALDDEGPVHTVTLPTFWMLRDEYTSSLFNRCLQAEACKADDVSKGGYNTYSIDAKRSHPINAITWEGAARACAWYGGRLPTEAEWEYAARGTDARRFPWGDEPGCGTVPVHRSGKQAERAFGDDHVMNTPPCSQEGTVSTGDVRGQSPFGVRGMGGNVWEWTADWYGPYAAGDVAAPTGLTEGSRRVQRGGGWTGVEASEFRAAQRMSMEPDARLNDVGFRCVWEGR